MRCLVVVPFMLLSVPAMPALAQTAPLDRIYACAAIADGANRLVCFDDAVAGLRQAEATGDGSVVDRAEVERARKDAFGLAASTSSAEAGSARRPATPEPDRVSLPVKSVVKTADGRHLFTMENGQVWRQTDNVRVSNIGDGPWQAEIRKAALGSFMLKLDGGTAVRVKRME
jgi:crotonobetainyl-CoA:carnitine CoA-transferase CaiB-like acyl-CoA transferase